LFNGLVCLDIPEQYRGASFNSTLIPSDMGDGYKNFMQEMYDSISSMRHKYKNMIICSPSSKSKTMLAYCIIQTLFRKGIPTFPLYDILEIKRIMQDMDFSRKQLYEIAEPDKLLTCPYLFVKIPVSTTFEVYETIATLVDRRVRRGNSTIFLYNGAWEQLVYNDSRGSLKAMLGDGSYNTIENRTWRSIK
jgi:hypothetical protein